MGFKDMTGMRFGILTVMHRMQNNSEGTAVWFCVCDCGQSRKIVGTSLRAGRHKSCGCKSPRFRSDTVRTHGMAGTRAYRIWVGMHTRCSDKCAGRARKNYFEKGIRVCDKWKSFEAFYADMGEPPHGMSLDRIDGSMGYSPENCRWATPKEQANNTAANFNVSYQGRTMTVSQWAEELGVKANTLLYRLRRGMSVEVAMQPKVTNARTVAAISRRRCCAVCGTEFLPRPAQLRAGGGRYCSQACNGASRVRERGLEETAFR